MLSDRLLHLLRNTNLDNVRLPAGVDVLDPMRGEHGGTVRRIVQEFHRKYLGDEGPRTLMLGINPGRLGAGSTGLCFTDTKRCESDLNIPVEGFRTHEPSSDFFYRVVRAMGGADDFYRNVYVQAICPLGFTKTGPKGTPVNLNYYDDRALQEAITPFVTNWLHQLIGTGMRSDRVFCIGKGKNLAYLEALNAQHGFFERIVPLEHPRFIMQYKAKQLERYVQKYVDALCQTEG
jgi:Domain of unknown function (DUF4918)